VNIMIMKKILIIIFLVFSLGYTELAFGADVKNVTAKQEGERIVFVYDLEGDNNSADVVLSLTANGKTYKSSELHIEGDYGKVTVGKAKTLYWNVLEDFSKGYAGAIDWELYSPDNKKIAYVPRSETYNIGQGTINTKDGYIEAKGVGVPPDRYIGTKNARSLALRAARVDAYRNLLEIAKGVQIDSKTYVKDYTVESDVINSHVEGLVKSAKVVEQQYMSDGTVEVKLRMDLNSLLEVISGAKRR